MFTSYVTRGIRIALILSLCVFLAYVFVAEGQGAGTTFATGSGQGKFDLKVDSTTYYNGVLEPTRTWNLKNLVPGVDKFWSFGDVKPGDTGTSSISLHISGGPAYACLDFYNYADYENGMNEPEAAVDNSSTTGELAEGLEFFAWRDDGDKKFEVGEVPLFGTSTQSAAVVLNNTSYAIADALTGSPLSGSTKYIGVYWCAGNLTVNTATAVASCDGQVLGNEAQTDSMVVDIGIRAVAASLQPKFTCNGVPPPVNWCEYEGHKYDEMGKPLSGWTIGLMKKVKHNKGTDSYLLTTDVTDKDGYFCLDWNGEKMKLEGKSTYKYGPKTDEYIVYEEMQSNWKNVDIEKGATWHVLAQVSPNQILRFGNRVGLSFGSTTTMNAAYHVDFYNYYEKKKKDKDHDGNWHGGHGHDHDEDEDDDDDDHGWSKVDDKKPWTSFVDACKRVVTKFRA